MSPILIRSIPLFIFFITSIATAQNRQATVTGELVQPTQSRFAYILMGNGPSQSVFYKSAVKDNRFNFSFPVKYSLQDTVLHAFFFLSDDSGMTNAIYREKVQQRAIRTSKFIIDSSFLKLRLDQQDRKLQVLEGGHFNKELEKYTEMMNEYERRFRDDNANPGGNTASGLDNNNEWRIARTATLIKTYNNSLLSLEYLRGLARLPVPGLTYKHRLIIDSAFAAITPALKERPDYKQFYKTFQDELRRSVPKQPPYFPAVSFENIKGEKLKLSSLHAEKKYLLLEFWATWCGPCIQQQPELEELSASYKDAQIMIVGISTDKKREDWQAYLTKKKSSYPDFRLAEEDQARCLDSLSIISIPRYVLLERSTGKIIEQNLPFEKIEAVLQKYQ